MIPTSVIKLFFIIGFLSFINELTAQDKNIKKDTLYLLFKKNNGKHYSSLGKKFINKRGINFNLYKKYFISKKEFNKDTLCLHHLKDYELTDEKDIEKKANLWREKNEEKLKNKYGLLYRQASQYNNDVFETFIIEKINSKQMVIYKVNFRNEGVIK